MRPRSDIRVLLCAIAIAFVAAGCGHYPPTNGGGGNNTAPVTLTFHDTPSNGVEVTSFEATVTGAVMQPGNVPLLSPPGQTIELTQLQANSAFLSTTTTVLAGTYNSLTITYANPIYTILNNSGGPLTIFGNTCAAGASCVVTPTGNTLTNTINGFLVSGSTTAGSLAIATGQPTLLEVDVNLNTVVQAGFNVDFSTSGAITATQLQSSQTTNVIDTLALSGTVTNVGTNPNQFTLTASTGQTFNTISVTSNTLFSQFDQVPRNNSTCTLNNFTCLATGQVVDVQLQILGDGTFQAAEVDFDDAASTQQVSGTIVALGSTTPPTSFTMIVHNTVPALASLPAGTPVTVTIGTGATFDINEGTFVLPTGSFSFASATDFLVGQEVEVRVSGSVTTGPPAAFTADRFALEQTQLTASVFNPNQGALSFFMNSLPPLFASPVIQIQVFTSSQTQFQTPTGSFNDLVSATPPVFSVGGFLFNSATSTPNLTAEIVRGPVTGP